MHLKTVTGSKEVSAYHFLDSCFLINSPRSHTTSSFPPCLPPSLPSFISPPPPKTANLASVRAWRTLSAVSTAELVVAPSAEELSPLVSVAVATQSPACSLIRE